MGGYPGTRITDTVRIQLKLELHFGTRVGNTYFCDDFNWSVSINLLYLMDLMLSRWATWTVRNKMYSSYLLHIALRYPAKWIYTQNRTSPGGYPSIIARPTQYMLVPCVFKELHLRAQTVEDQRYKMITVSQILANFWIVSFTDTSK